MALPDDSMEDEVLTGTYTADEVQHIIARRVARQQLRDLTARVTAQEMKQAEHFAEVSSKLNNLIEMVSRSRTEQSVEISECRDQLERDIADSYVSNEQLEVHMANMRVTFVKHSTLLSGVVAVLAFMAQYVFKSAGGP